MSLSYCKADIPIYLKGYKTFKQVPQPAFKDQVRGSLPPDTPVILSHQLSPEACVSGCHGDLHQCDTWRHCHWHQHHDQYATLLYDRQLYNTVLCDAGKIEHIDQHSGLLSHCVWIRVNAFLLQCSVTLSSCYCMTFPLFTVFICN